MASNILNEIQKLRCGPVGLLVNSKIGQFRLLSCRGNNEWFSELCFCILTANSSARMGIKIQKAIGSEGFMKLPYEVLSRELKMLGYRFYNTRSHYIVLARVHRKIKDIIESFNTGEDARLWLVANIKGIGYKEASHFLRNVGYSDLAILDRHILKTMLEQGMMNEIPKALTGKTYFALEKKLRSLAAQACLTLAELDLYLWYLKTGTLQK